MGLAAPRKRTKLSHDPRNTAWQASPSASFGHRLMSSQGWKPGDALGSTSSTHHTSSSGVGRRDKHGNNSSDAQNEGAGGRERDRAEENKARLAAARVGVLFKDDTLGLGAKAGATDVEARSAGLDAFVGLLGRLNAKDQGEVEAVERVHKKKVGDGVLERYARGKGWGMVFVRGGVLRGGEEYGTEKELAEYGLGKEKAKKAEKEDEGVVGDVVNEGVERKRQREEKRKRKEERQVRREAKALRKSAKGGASLPPKEERERKHKTKTRVSVPRTRSSPDEAVSDDTPSEQTIDADVLKRRTLAITDQEAPPKQIVSNGRHILRGRNIAAKRMAFSDTKGLDAIFMKR